MTRVRIFIDYDENLLEAIRAYYGNFFWSKEALQTLRSLVEGSAGATLEDVLYEYQNGIRKEEG